MTPALFTTREETGGFEMNAKRLFTKVATLLLATTILLGMIVVSSSADAPATSNHFNVIAVIQGQ